MKVFWDVDTQNDFMNSNGALYVPNAEEIKPNLRLLTEFGLKKAIPILGSVDRHFGTPEYKEREGELQKYGGPFPDHCMNGEDGQKKVSDTRLPDFRTYFIPNLLRGSQEGFLENVANMAKLGRGEVYFEKQHFDVFTNPDSERFLRRIKVDEAVVYGVATDYCVKAAVLGMQRQGIQTYVVTDAIRGITPEGAAAALEEMANAGAKFLTTQEVLEGRI